MTYLYRCWSCPTPHELHLTVESPTTIRISGETGECEGLIEALRVVGEDVEKERKTVTDTRPLAVDLFTGLHGWAEGLVAEGFRVIGFDIEDMCAQFGAQRPPHTQLVIQDVRTIHGSQFPEALARHIARCYYPASSKERAS